MDAGDIEMAGVEGRAPLDALENAVRVATEAGAIPLVLGGDHTITWPDVTGVARVKGWGRISVLHFDAHADTGTIQFGSLVGHGLPMRRLIESGACRGDRFLQIGLRGYWPEPPTLQWMAEQNMRSFEMHEVVRRGLDAVLAEAFAIAVDDCDGVFVSVDLDVVDPGMAPGTGTPEPGGLTGRQLLDACGESRSSCRWSGSTWWRSRRPTTRRRSRPSWPTAWCWRCCPASLTAARAGPGRPSHPRC